MVKIFISYRRDDSQYQTDRLYDLLSKHVEDPPRDIFLDVDTIPYGVDFVEHLEGKVSECEIVLAIIGKNWVDAKDPETGVRRLDNPNDFIRVEIATALQRGIPVVPVLLDGAPVPKPEQLPDDMKALSRRNGVIVNRLSFNADVENLVSGLPITLKARSEKAPLLEKASTALEQSTTEAAGVPNNEKTGQYSGSHQQTRKPYKAAVLGAIAALAAATASVYGFWPIVSSVVPTGKEGIPTFVDRALSSQDYSIADDRTIAERVLADVPINTLRKVSSADPRATWVLGVAYDRGIAGIPRDEDEALRLFQLSCDQDFSRGCSTVGSFFYAGQLVEQDYERAADLIRIACEDDIAQACFSLGGIYEEGKLGPPRLADAATLYGMACEMGLASPCSRLGKMYETGNGVAVDLPRAVELYRQACAAGNSAGCGDLGTMYISGKGVDLDETLAVELYQQACDGGDALRCGILAYMYENGSAVSVDEILAAGLYQKACDGGHVPSCSNLGLMFDSGRGVVEDDVRALELYKQACEAGFESGCTNAATLE